MNYSSINPIFDDLIKIKSDTGTALEKNVEEYIYNFLSDLEYFQKNKNHFGKYTLEDQYDRDIIWGLFKNPDAKKTVILLHHHDVVDALDYGKFKKLAYSPEKLKSAYQKMDWPRTIQKDLADDNWLFGRGTSDMKAGAAIQMNLLENYTKENLPTGNVLLLSVPDEETYSTGMRKSIKLLTDLQEQFDLEYQLLIDSEPHERTKTSEGTYYDGSVGKLMPVIYVRGFKSHIGEIFSGFNPSLILSNIVRRTETNIDFSDEVNGEISPPPSWSYMRDFKENYDASIPEASGGYFSVLTLQQTPKEILEKLKNISKEAFKESIKIINSNYKNYSRDNTTLDWKPKVKFYSEIYQEALTHDGKSFEKEFHKTLEKIKKELKEGLINIPESNFSIIQKTLEHVPYNDPVVVIGISPPYYPHVSNDSIDNSDKIKDIYEVINKKAKDFNETYRLKKYFMGISDMSYTSLKEPEKIIPYIEKNMALWGDFYKINFEALAQLSIPVINLGPWGKDLHKMTERVFMKDVLDRTPTLINEVIQYVLEKKEE